VSTRETWLLDLGNSRAKLARLEDGLPADITALEWSQPDFVVSLRNLVQAWPRPERILIASVAPAAAADRIRELLPGDSSLDIRWLRSPRTACGIRNRYAKPERLGIDRFLAMAAVRARTSEAAIVVGCGTALTLDAIAPEGQQLPGLIAPSAAGMLDALRAGTAIADSNPEAFAGADGDDTAMALQAGCWAAAGALVEWFVTRQRAALGSASVWLHGGWSEPLADWLARDGTRVERLEHAVLHGLALYGERP
jgi:type III pantothenate kinase